MKKYDNVNINDIKIKTIYRSSPDRQPGAQWDTIRYGKFEILGKVDDGTGKYYVVKFLNTGSIRIANGSAFADGTIKDYYAPIVQGKGYFGEGKYTTVKNKRESQLWYNMLERCYCNKFHQRCPTYIGCEVCDRWLNFQNFCEDLPLIEGYDKWLNKNNKYALDKDTKIPDNKIYSLETCRFIYEGDNTIASNESKSIYEGIDRNEEVYYFRNQRIFAEKYGLERRGISAVVSGDQKSHRGWRFRRLTEEEMNNIDLGLVQD